MLLPPRFGNLDNFYLECFSFPALFRNQGTDKLLASYGDVYPYLVRVFYSNVVIKKGILTSNIKETPISLIFKDFGEALGIPHEGVEIRNNGNVNLTWYNKTEFYYGTARIYEH